MNRNDQSLYGGLPTNINVVNPVARADASSIVSLVKKNGRITGYLLSNGQTLSKAQGVELAKQGGIKGVAVAERKGSEYLRSLPDGKDNNNLGNLPSTSM